MIFLFGGEKQILDGGEFWICVIYIMYIMYIMYIYISLFFVGKQ